MNPSIKEVYEQMTEPQKALVADAFDAGFYAGVKYVAKRQGEDATGSDTPQTDEEDQASGDHCVAGGCGHSL
jgi:hypothetical protein